MHLPLGLFFMYNLIMDTSIEVIPKKKKRGRPATGKDPLLAGRVPVSLITALEEWAVRHGVSRSEAIRRLIQRGLESEETKQRK